MFRTAPAPTKANNSFLLSMGLLNIPLAVLSGTESTRVERKEFVNGNIGQAVGRQAYDKSTGKVVEQTDITRMALASDGVQWVVLTDEEIAEATMPKGVAEVIAFVPTNKLHAAYVTSKIDQVRARTSGFNKPQARAAEHAFSVFLTGLRNRKVAALVQVALRGPAQYAAITPDGDLLWLYPADGIRQAKAFDTFVTHEREVDLMGQLIDSYDKGTPVITDTTAAAVQAFVDAKAGGATTPVGPPPAIESDLFGALTASIKANKQAKVTA